ncbi:MAG TPA: tetratricopeptide repeat protein, partial [Kofleriaceae bacterium]|nr:tetratricopeptide repeat protein [Kofleriaceae bacterium]
LDGSLAALAQARALREQLLVDDPEHRTQHQIALVHVLSETGLGKSSAGDIDGAETAFGELLALVRALAAAQPLEARLAEADAQDKLGGLRAMAHDDLDGSLAAHRRGIELLEGLPDETGGGRAGLILVDNYEGAAQVLRVQRDLAGSLDYLRRGEAVLQRMAAARPADHWRVYHLAQLRISIGRTLQGMDRGDDALAALGAARRALGELMAADADNAVWRSAYGMAGADLGDAFYHLGRNAEALTAYQDALPIDAARAAAEPENDEMQMQYAMNLGDLGRVQQASGQLREAADSLRAAIAIGERIHARAPGSMYFAQILLANLGNLAMVEDHLGDRPTAIGHSARALALAREVAGRAPSDVLSQYNFAALAGNAGETAARQGDRATARVRFTEAVAALEPFERSGRLPADGVALLADLRKALRRLPR